MFIWLPAGAVAAAMVLPVAYLIIRTLDSGGEAWELLAQVHILAILGRSVLLALTVTVASIAIAVPLAWLTVRTDLPFRRVWGVVTLLPLVIPSYVGGFLVIEALGPRGMLQGLLEPLFGVERLPDIYGFPGAMLTLTLLSYPYVLLPVRAALRRLDPSLEENSRTLGFSTWTTFRRVTLPLLRPAIAAGALLVALYTLSDFGAVSLLQYETFTRAIYVQYESAFDRTLAAALSLVLVALAFGILAMEALTRGQTRYYRSSASITRPPGIVRLERWRWPALAFCALVVLFSLAMPTSILTYWVVRGVSAGEPLSLFWSGAWNSLSISGLAAVAAMVAALPISILVVRHPSLVSALLERITYVGFALPGIVVALALVFFGANYATPLYQTMGLLILAYVVLFLPAAVGGARTSLLQVNPRTEEAARSLGRTPLQVLASVTVPLMIPGILAGAATVFLLTVKELPATLILSPIGFDNLATSIWSAASEAFFARAAMPALMLIFLSSIPMALIIFRERR